jgi:hypothetical protein
VVATGAEVAAGGGGALVGSGVGAAQAASANKVIKTNNAMKRRGVNMFLSSSG